MHDVAAAHNSSRVTRHALESGLGVEDFVCPPRSPVLIHMNFIHVELNERAPSPFPSQMYRRCRERILGSCDSVRCGHVAVCVTHFLSCSDVTSAFKWTKAS